MVPSISTALPDPSLQQQGMREPLVEPFLPAASSTTIPTLLQQEWQVQEVQGLVQQLEEALLALVEQVEALAAPSRPQAPSASTLMVVGQSS